MFRLEDLDSLDVGLLAPANYPALGQRTAFCPFRVAASRDALGPKLGRRVRDEMDQQTVRINVVRAAALVHLAQASVASNLTRMLAPTVKRRTRPA